MQNTRITDNTSKLDVKVNVSINQYVLFKPILAIENVINLTVARNYISINYLYLKTVLFNYYYSLSSSHNLSVI